MSWLTQEWDTNKDAAEAQKQADEAEKEKKADEAESEAGTKYLSDWGSVRKDPA
jgi:hypothetical protein